MKIGIIGASGAVGQEVIRILLYRKSLPKINLFLFYNSDNSKNKLLGMMYDMTFLEKYGINIKICNDESNLLNLDVVIICAGKSVSTNINSIPDSNSENDNNRNNLYNDNKDMIIKWGGFINQYCPHAIIILVTNPVSRLLKDIYLKYPHLKVIGCGITNDTMRIRNELIKSFPSSNISELFVLGEHSLSNQTVALEHFNHKNLRYIPRERFEFIFENDNEKLNYISMLKNLQNQLISSGNIILNMYDTMPIVYRSYFNHRLAHFLYKTHLSTANSICEIIEAVYFEDRIVSVEMKVKSYNGFSNCILGIPIKFIDHNIVPQNIEIDSYERAILRQCELKYGGIL